MKALIDYIEKSYKINKKQPDAIFFDCGEASFCLTDWTIYATSEDGTEFYSTGSKAKTVKAVDKFVSLRA